MNKYLKNNYLLITIIIFAALLRIYHIDFQSIWIDEIHTMIESNPKLEYQQFYDIMIFREQMPHLYFLITRLATFIFGNSVIVVRMISAIIGLLSIYSIYLLGNVLFSKKTGIISASLLSVNYFHIWYSQEARPYILLCLFTILSFYRLIIFLRNYNLKNTIYYAIFASLMINTHFFGLFVLVSQMLIIGLLLLEKPQGEKNAFLKKSIISGILILICWLPSVKIFIVVAKIKSFWIQPPSSEVYTQLFKDLFGGAESILFLVLILSIYYFINIFQTKHSGKIIDNKNVFGFFIITIWVFITLYIPFLRSHLDIPMIISRYFISVLPAIIIILSVAISKIHQSYLQKFIWILFIVLSLTDLLAVKKYYSTPSKTQYEKIVQQIIKKNTNKEVIVSTWAWHLNYFFNNADIQIPTREQTLQNFVENLKNQTIEAVPFWFVAGNYQKYELSEEAQSYLDLNYNLIENLEYYDCWAKYYIPKNGSKLTNQNSLRLDMFKTATFDGAGNMILFENSNKKSVPVSLEKGNYELLIKAISLPKDPINDENGHIIIKLNDREIVNYYTSNLEKKSESTFPFSCNEDANGKFEIIYDNDFANDKMDRNIIINFIKLQKK
jgi:4-amino-4-deoxy-L-arabinose transferase-like glycosyltransferase/SHS2 domain-containing protein